jgi:8-oxo-dGTP diphosphatase
VDLVLLAFREGALAVLLVPGDGGGGRGRRTLPWRWLDAGEGLDRAAAAAARDAVGSVPAWLTQVRAYDTRQRHPGDADLSVAFVGLVPAGGGEEEGWTPVGRLPALAPRHRDMVDDALAALRARTDLSTIAFQLLPRAFTLSQLQEAYELLLGRRLHKASFRRALQGARLVQPLEQWRSEGRGRPAQLYRHAPAKRRPGSRSARFDWG